QSLGKFGGDTDNWEWPRHTADFSMFRIYTDKDGKPASYSADNIPLKPKYHFPISIKGLAEGDFAMIMGFPGTTERFLTSYGLEETMNITNRLTYEIRTVKINVLRKEMAASQEVRIKYASKYASCSNYWKYSLQQNKALKNLNTIEVKREIERNYLNWAKTQESTKYTEALSKIKNGYKGRAEAQVAIEYLSEGLLSGPELLYFAFRQSNNIAEFLEGKDVEKNAELRKKTMKAIDDFYKNFDIEVERKLLTEMIDYTYKNLDKNYYPEFFDNVLAKKFKGNASKYADYILKNSIFSSKDKLLAAIDGGKFRKTVVNDAAFAAGNSAMQMMRSIYNKTDKFDDDIADGEHYFVKGILKMNSEKFFAPDANSTIRLTYGNIKEYEPKDGVTYHFYTTLKGVIEKEDPNSTEFIVPEKIKTLYKNRDYGQYADKNGELPVCFITNNDITGGNSGSPVLDADGNLIGLAFDGNGEAMSGDIDFEENLQRCINLDVRYMLFIIDKVADAKHLIDEMTLVK
ncbi:MAG: S46 family peptidase, partial [Prevotellaceae bacterium]|nr:S46 family peptidase [Prevotellaceae bacterium]